MWMSKRLKLYFADRCPSTWGRTPPPSKTLWWRAVNRTAMTSLRSASRGWWRTPSEWWGWCRWIFVSGVEALQTRHCHYHFHLHFRLHRQWRRDYQSVIVLFYLMHRGCCLSFSIFPIWWVFCCCCCCCCCCSSCCCCWYCCCCCRVILLLLHNLVWLSPLTGF